MTCRLWPLTKRAINHSPHPLQSLFYYWQCACAWVIVTHSCSDFKRVMVCIVNDKNYFFSQHSQSVNITLSVSNEHLRWSVIIINSYCSALSFTTTLSVVLFMAGLFTPIPYTSLLSHLSTGPLSTSSFLKLPFQLRLLYRTSWFSKIPFKPVTMYFFIWSPTGYWFVVYHSSSSEVHNKMKYKNVWVYASKKTNL